MSSLANVNDTLGIVNGVGQLLKNARVDKAIGYIGKGAKLASDIANTGGALTQFSSQTTIISRAFIEEAVTNEPVLPNLMKSFHEWYAAQILSALSLSQMVDGKRTVQDFMTILQTGQNARQRSVVGNVLSHIGERKIGQESFLTNYLGEGNFESSSALEALGDYTDKLVSKNKSEMDQLKQDAKFKEEYKNTKSVSNLKSLNVSENKIGPIGELFEVTLTNPTNKDLAIKVPIYVQMQPNIIPTDIAPRFIDMNVDPNIWNRWTMMKAGEISFWKDFVLKRDLHKRRRSVLKDPEAAKAFSEFLRTVAKKDAYALADVTDKSTNPKSANLANSVIIFTDDTIQRCKAESNIDLYDAKDRQQYFRNAYVMILAVVDTIHQRVRVWFNGIDGSLDLSYQDFKPDNKNFEPNDFMAALQAFSTNQIGRLR